MRMEIFNENFSNQNEAIKKIASFDYGIKKSSKFNIRKFAITFNEKDEEEISNIDFDLCFESENEDGFYFYRIENHIDYFKLIIEQTVKHKMIDGAIQGDLELLINNFSNTNKMKGFALEKAIENGNWEIVEYIVDHYIINQNPLRFAIRFNNKDILSRLMRKGIELPKDWLAYCMSNDSIEVTKQLLLVEKAHLRFQKTELQTNWFHQEVQKDKITSKFIREIFQIEPISEVLKRMKL